MTLSVNVWLHSKGGTPCSSLTWIIVGWMRSHQDKKNNQTTTLWLSFKMR